MEGRGTHVSPFCALIEDFSAMALKDLGRLDAFSDGIAPNP